MLEIDHWALSELDAVIEKVRAAYEAYEFHTVYHALYGFCTVTLSARYFDIVKDRLYTFAPRNPARRSAQSALFRIADALARMLAPILVFTADEIWESLPDDGSRSASVHLAELPVSNSEKDEALRERWNQLLDNYRSLVLYVLEHKRINGEIGSSLEAHVTIHASGETYDLLDRYRDDLRYIFIVSQVDLIQVEDYIAEHPPKVHVERAAGKKCERCWNYSTRVGESSRYPTVCERCVAALEEIEASPQLS